MKLKSKTNQTHFKDTWQKLGPGACRGLSQNQIYRWRAHIWLYTHLFQLIIFYRLMKTLSLDRECKCVLRSYRPACSRKLQSEQNKWLLDYRFTLHMVYYLNRKENTCVIALLDQRKHQSGQHQQYIHHVQYIAYIKINFVELYDHRVKLANVWEHSNSQKEKYYQCQG